MEPFMCKLFQVYSDCIAHLNVENVQKCFQEHKYSSIHSSSKLLQMKQ